MNHLLHSQLLSRPLVNSAFSSYTRATQLLKTDQSTTTNTDAYSNHCERDHDCNQLYKSNPTHLPTPSQCPPTTSNTILESSSYEGDYPPIQSTSLSALNQKIPVLNQWTLVARRKQPDQLNPIRSDLQPSTPSTRPLRRIIGNNKSSSSKISSATLGKWYIFAGHLDRNTSEADLKDHLESNGINVIEIKKLDPRQPWQDKSSAFKLCISLHCKDSIMNPDLWPDHSDIRDWYFKPKQ